MASKEEGHIVRAHDHKLVATTQQAHREVCHASMSGASGQKEKCFRNKSLPDASHCLNTRHGRAFPCVAHHWKTLRQRGESEERARSASTSPSTPRAVPHFVGCGACLTPRPTPSQRGKHGRATHEAFCATAVLSFSLVFST